MLITRTPLRVTLGGGGTDLPAYYESSGEGFLVAAAINKYIYVAVHDNFAQRYLVKYSQIEDVNSPNEVEHPIIREALIRAGVGPGVEITSLADIPAGTGLGSSGAFTVGLLKALYLWQHMSTTNLEIASDACEIEIDKLGEPVGKQDQYICALGGLTSLTFRRGGEVAAQPVVLDSIVRKDLEEHLMLFYTGIQRRAVEELQALHEGADLGQPSIRENLDQIRDLGYRAAASLATGDLDGFGGMLTEQWHLKLQRSPGALHRRVDEWLAIAIQAGARGGKLVGAGGGGFLLIFAERRAPVRKAMREIGLREVDIAFDYLGSTVVVQ